MCAYVSLYNIYNSETRANIFIYFHTHTDNETEILSKETRKNAIASKCIMFCKGNEERHREREAGRRKTTKKIENFLCF